MASRVRSSGVGPRPPVLMIRSDLPSAYEGVPDHLQPIRQGGPSHDLDAPCREFGSQVPGIGVARRAGRQLRADGDQLGGAKR